MAWGPDADRRAKLLICLVVKGSLLDAYSHLFSSGCSAAWSHRRDRQARAMLRGVPKIQSCRNDEAIFRGSRSRPETAFWYESLIEQRTGANMLVSILNAIYREFLNSAIPGMAALGGRR